MKNAVIAAISAIVRHCTGLTFSELFLVAAIEAIVKVM